MPHQQAGQTDEMEMEMEMEISSGRRKVTLRGIYKERDYSVSSHGAVPNPALSQVLVALVLVDVRALQNL